MTVTLVRLGGRPDQPLLLLGPSLGTSVAGLWSAAASVLAEDFQVVGWDLPGHGTNTAEVPARLTMADLARDVLRALDDMLGGFEPAGFHYAGNSVGGAVGLQLLLDAPERVASATLLCTGAILGSTEAWRERSIQVERSGTASFVTASAGRWFAPGFRDREPLRASRLLADLEQASDAGYSAVCGALGSFDVRDRLDRVAAPVLAIAGAYDVSTPPALLEDLARDVRHGRTEILDGVAHLAPAGAPERVADLVRTHALGPRSDRHAELAMHLRAALTDGVSVEEIQDLLLQAAVDCGLSATNDDQGA